MPSRSNAVALSLTGDIDYDIAADISARIKQYADRDRDLVVDVSAVSFADVSGCRMFVRAAQELQPGRKLILLHARRQLMRALGICGWLGSPQLLVVPNDAEFEEV
jgi:anti-anti-sigma factor